MRGVLVGSLLLSLPAVRADAAEPPVPSAEVTALEQAVQQAIARAEPSVACVLVSRSTAYYQYEEPPSFEEPGKLGRFPPAPSDRTRPLPTPEQAAALALHNPDHVPESYGSGVVVDENLVLTSAHVVRNATKIYVRLPGGRGSYANIHAADPRSDLAVLRLLDRVGDLKAMALGDGGAVRKGQFVVLLANPFAAGFRDGSPSASWGLIANVRRRGGITVDERERNRAPLAAYATLLQTDARIEVGCSGGALLNLKGEMIGLTTALPAV